MIALQLLPHLERASIQVEKLRDYVLNPEHPEGRNKARVFKSTLGIEREHANALAETIQYSLPRALAGQGRKDRYGERWTTYHEIVGLNGKSAVVTVAWIFESQEPEVPKLVSCYIESQNQEKLRHLLRQG